MKHLCFARFLYFFFKKTVQIPHLPLGLREDFSPCDPFLSSRAEPGKALSKRRRRRIATKLTVPLSSSSSSSVWAPTTVGRGGRGGEREEECDSVSSLAQEGKGVFSSIQGKSAISHTKKCRWKQMWSLKEMSQHKAIEIKIVFDWGIAKKLSAKSIM